MGDPGKQSRSVANGGEERTAQECVKPSRDRYLKNSAQNARTANMQHPLAHSSSAACPTETVASTVTASKFLPHSGMPPNFLIFSFSTGSSQLNSICNYLSATAQRGLLVTLCMHHILQS